MRDNELREELAGHYSPYVVAIDGWTMSGTARGFEGVVLLWLSQHATGVTVERRVLRLKPLGTYVKSAAVLAQDVRAALADCGLISTEASAAANNAEHKDRLLCLVSDTAADVSAAARELEVEPHGCLFHVVNLAYKDAKVCLAP